MGIVKIASNEPTRKSIYNCRSDERTREEIASNEPTRKSSYNCGSDELTREEVLLLQKFPCYDSHECEFAEVGCELAMSGGQICNVPYDLYDLPDLKEVFSLETWNLCLTEEDRFSLAAYLPDMDQHNFFVTIKELFNGSSLFFGSPLGSFFHRLKAGFYSPQVTQAREALLFFQRRGYYHSLKSCHDGMVQKFADMERLWSSCQQITSVEERVRIWKNWRYNKPLMLVDLNTSPSDENLSSKGDREAETFPQLKRPKHMDGIVTTHRSDFSADLILAKAKGVLRVKSMETDSSKNHLLQPPNESSAKYKQLPKGVLKMKTKGASPTHEKGIFHTPGQITTDPLGIHYSSFSTPHFAPAWDAYSFSEISSYPYCHINKHESTSGNSHSSVWQREEALETGALLAKSSLSIQNKVNIPREVKTDNSADVLRGLCQSKANHSLSCFNKASNIREFPNEKNLLKNFGQHNGLIHESSPDPYTCATESHQKKGYLTLFRPKNAENISRMLTLGTSKHPSVTNLSDNSETTHKYHGDLKLKTPPGNMSVTQFEEGHMFPITYKRKKAHKKLNLVDSLKKSTMVVDLDSPTLPTSTANVKRKAIKIKFKGWSNYVAGCKQ